MENKNTFTNVNEIKIYQSKNKLKSQGRHKLDIVWLIISFLFYLKTWNEGKCKSERVGAEIVWDGREEPRVGLAGCELYDDDDNDDDDGDDDDDDDDDDEDQARGMEELMRTLKQGSGTKQVLEWYHHCYHRYRHYNHHRRYRCHHCHYCSIIMIIIFPTE